MSASSTTAAPIEFEGLVKRFGRRTVLDDLTFTVPAGTVVGLLGPNGAGKSTAMRVLLGLQRPTEGHARILGHAPGSRGFREATRKVGAIIEAPPLYKNASAMQNLEIRVAAMGLSMQDAEVRGILNRVGMADRADDPIGSFSLGMRQRIGIALALVGDPSIVVLDEPTNGLDPEGSVEIRNLVRSLPERGATTLLCTHRLAEVEATCDYVVLLQNGRLVTEGSLDDVIASASAGGVIVEVAPDELERAHERRRAGSGSASPGSRTARSSPRRRPRPLASSRARWPSRGSTCAACACAARRSKTRSSSSPIASRSRRHEGRDRQAALPADAALDRRRAPPRSADRRRRAADHRADDPEQVRLDPQHRDRTDRRSSCRRSYSASGSPRWSSASGTLQRTLTAEPDRNRVLDQQAGRHAGRRGRSGRWPSPRPAGGLTQLAATHAGIDIDDGDLAAALFGAASRSGSPAAAVGFGFGLHRPIARRRHRRSGWCSCSPFDGFISFIPGAEDYSYGQLTQDLGNNITGAGRDRQRPRRRPDRRDRLVRRSSSPPAGRGSCAATSSSPVPGGSPSVITPRG